MTQQAFSLIPFRAPAALDISVTGQLSYKDNLIRLHYSLRGNIDRISLPAPARHPSRKDELWKGTCFEFFLAIKDQPQYWEFNMSPAGDWNAYRMDAYRRVGFREETSIQSLQIEVHKTKSLLTLGAVTDLSPILQKSEPVELGITAVLQLDDGGETYWALAHPASQADFHWRGSFLLTPAAQSHPLGQSDPGD